MTGKPGPLFPAPAAAASLYPGEVMHARMKPKAHRFRYRVFNLLIDLDRLDEAGRLSRLFSVDRFNLLSFFPRDHGEERASLAARARALIAQAGVEERPERLLLLCYPRVLGFVFNPISVYFAYAADGRLLCLIYEVRNTFGQRHSYVAPVRSGEASEAGIRQERDKLFYVSPFLDMPLRYHFRIRPPGDNAAIRILETDAEGPILAATFQGSRRDLTARTIMTACLGMPLMTLKVVAGINWEALKLWLKGIRIYRRPAPPAPASFGDAAGARQQPTTTGVA